MDVTVFATYPTTADKRGSETHEPSVGVVVRRTRLATHIGRYLVAGADAGTCSLVDDGTKHGQHFVGTLLTDDLLHLWSKGSQDVTVVVLNMGHKHGLGTYSLVGKGGIGTHHFAYRNFTRSQTKGRCRLDVKVAYAEAVNQILERIRIEFAHQVSRNPVVRLGQSPLQRHHLAIAVAVGVARAPRLAIFGDDGLLHITGFVTRAEAVLHCQGIEVRFDGRTHLTAAHHSHVILEMGEVRTSHIGLYMTGRRFHRHESTTQEMFVVPDAVHRRHHRVYLSLVIAEDGHLMRFVKCLSYLLGRMSGFAHQAVAFALLHRTGQDCLHLLGTQLIGIGSRAPSLLFFEESRLQVFLHMLVHSLLSIALHTTVDGGIDLQSVGIDIVGTTVFLVILVAPAIQGVCLPRKGVFVILLVLPVGIETAHRLLGHQAVAQIHTQVGGNTFLVVCTTKLQSNRYRLQRITFGITQETGFLHL